MIIEIELGVLIVVIIAFGRALLRVLWSIREEVQMIWLEEKRPDRKAGEMD
jgi:hypothetical protein